MTERKSDKGRKTRTNKNETHFEWELWELQRSKRRNAIENLNTLQFVDGSNGFCCCAVINFVSSLAPIVKSFFHHLLWSLFTEEEKQCFGFVLLFFFWSFAFSFVALFSRRSVQCFFSFGFVFVSKQKKHLIGCGWMEEWTRLDLWNENTSIVHVDGFMALQLHLDMYFDGFEWDVSISD